MPRGFPRSTTSSCSGRPGAKVPTRAASFCARAKPMTVRLAAPARAPNWPAWRQMENCGKTKPGSRKASWAAPSKAPSPGWIGPRAKSFPGSRAAPSSMPKAPCCWTNATLSAGAFAMNPVHDLIIVGAGIVGAACAAECARAGLKVLVLDRGPIGAGTTGAGMGHLVVMDDSEAQFALTSYSVSLWHQLAPRLPLDVEYDPCGTLWLAADEEEMTEVHRKQKYYCDRGVRVEVLDATAVHRAEPNLRPGMAGGLR